MTRRADHDKQRQARVLTRLLAESGRTQTQAAAAGDISYPHFRRFLDGRTPLRDDLYALVARAVGVTERELRLALAGERDEQAPPGWDLRAELNRALPDQPEAVERAYRHLAELPYDDQRDAVMAYRVISGLDEPHAGPWPFKPDNGSNVQRNVQRTAG